MVGMNFSTVHANEVENDDDADDDADDDDEDDNNDDSSIEEIYEDGSGHSNHSLEQTNNVQFHSPHSQSWHHKVMEDQLIPQV
ncbi:hypothetical protein ACLB2K_071638 [Fragaria x ananassa]